MEQSRKEQSGNRFRFFQRLGERALRHVSTFLLIAFLFANASFVYADLDVDQHSSKPATAELFLLDSDCSLDSTPAEGRELRVGRDGSDRSSPQKLHGAGALQHDLGMPVLSPAFSFPEDIRSLHLFSPCTAPFSPRPPPSASAQV